MPKNHYRNILEKGLYPALNKLLGFEYKPYTKGDRDFEKIREVIQKSEIYRAFSNFAFLGAVNGSNFFTDWFFGRFKNSSS